MNNNLSENLKKIRKENKISQEQLAEELGVSRQAISKWESGIAYPEMDKLIQIAEKFNLNIDDLLHKDISEVKEAEKSKKEVNKYIDSFFKFITDTVCLFSNMSSKNKIKCVFEQLMIAFVLYIITLIIGSFGIYIIRGIFSGLPYRIYNIIFGIFSSVYIIVALSISCIIIIHNFKVRYLDYYKDLIKNTKEKNENKNSEDSSDLNFKRNEEKVIIRDQKHSEYSFIDIFVKGSILCIKILSIFVLWFLCIGLVGLFIGFILSFLICKTGLFFIGILLTIISLSTIDIDFILVLMNFIFTRKNNKKIIIWSFITSIVVLGAGVGLTMIGCLDFEFIDNNNVPESYKSEKISIDMNDSLFIYDYFNDDIEYIEKDIDNVEIEYSINKKCDINYNVLNNGGLNLYNYCVNPIPLLKQFIKNVNEKKIDFSELRIKNVKIYTNKENIEILNNNYKNNRYELNFEELED